MDPALGRRALLIGVIGAGAVGVGVLATGCSGEPGTVSTTPGASDDQAQADTTDAVRGDVASAERLLIAQYDAVITAYPVLAAALTPIRTQHADHLAAMGVDVDEPAVVAPAPTAEAARTGLIAAEREAARARRASCVSCTDAELTRLIALIAASEQSHVPALKSLTGA